MTLLDELFSLFNGYVIAGVVLAVIAGGLLFATRDTPDLRTPMRCIAFPLFGCSGCMLILPLFGVGSIVVLGGALMSCLRGSIC